MSRRRLGDRTTTKFDRQALRAVLSQSRLTLCNPKDCNPPASSVHGILQARRREWVAMPSSRGSSRARDRTRISLGLLQALCHERHLGSPDRPCNKPGKLHLSLQGSLSRSSGIPWRGRGAGPYHPPEPPLTLPSSHPRNQLSLLLRNLTGTVVVPHLSQKQPFHSLLPGPEVGQHPGACSSLEGAGGQTLGRRRIETPGVGILGSLARGAGSGGGGGHGLGPTDSWPRGETKVGASHLDLGAGQMVTRMKLSDCHHKNHNISKCFLLRVPYMPRNRLRASHKFTECRVAHLSAALQACPLGSLFSLRRRIF